MSIGANIKQALSIMPQYGLQVHQIDSCRSLYNRSAAFRANTDRGTILIKPFKGQQSRLAQVSSRIEWLQKKGFQHLPKWFATKTGKRWVKHKGRLYYVSEWVEGSQLGDNLQDYELLGEVLGKLHKISYRSSGSSPSTIAKIQLMKMENSKFRRNLRLLKHHGTAAGSWYREMGDRCLVLAEEAWKILSRSDVRRVLVKEKPNLIHGDVTRPNVICNASGVYLVDWEYTRKGTTYYEVAKTLSNITNFSVANMNAFLSGYVKHRPLKKEERLIISAFFRLPREAWQAAAMLRANKNPPVFDILKSFWSNRLAAIEWMDGWTRQS